MKKHGMMSWPVRLFCALLFSVFCAFSAASTIVAHDSGVTYIQASAAVGNADLLQVRPANAHGISINRFEKFEIRDRALKLVNATGGHGSAGLVVIIADEIVLEHELVGVGPAADILLISPDSSGSIVCRFCSFSGFNRVSLAAAEGESSFEDGMNSIGSLDATPAGSVVVDDLSAHGAISVDMLANKIAVRGTVDTHLRADKNSFGGYSETPNGSLLIGSGSVNVIAGNSTWNYDDQELIKIRPSTGSKSVIEGEIRTLHLKVSAGDHTEFGADVDTRTDLLSAVRYRGKAHVVEEGITFQNFGAEDTAVSGQITSEGTVAIRSNASIKVLPSASIEGSKTVLTARNDVDNRGSVVADVLEIAAHTIRNRSGRFEVFQEMSAWAEKHIHNEFGGRIVARSIALHSEDGIIRNGSRTPFIPSNEVVDELLNYDWTDVDKPNPLEIGNYIVGSLKLGEPGPLEIGTYYKNRIERMMDISAEVASKKDRAQDHSAFIGAQEVSLKAKAVENINPYWKRLSSSGANTIEKAALNQVTISAENLLQVEASDYLVNSSARLLVNEPSGRMRLNARVLSNERYRAMLAAEEISSNTTDWRGVHSNLAMESTETNEYRMTNFAFSPPGVIVSMGDLELNSLVGFVNNISHFEIFGNASFSEATSKITDFGLGNDGATVEQVETRPTHVCYVQFSSGNYAFCDHFDTTETEVTIDPSEGLESLFFVHGDAKGPTADFKTVSQSALHEQVAESLLARYTRNGLNVGELEDNLYPRRLHAEVRFNETDPNRVYVDSWFGEWVVDTKQEGTEKTQAFSFAEEVKRVVEKVKQAIVDLFDEFMGWWD